MQPGPYLGLMLLACLGLLGCPEHGTGGDGGIPQDSSVEGIPDEGIPDRAMAMDQDAADMAFAQIDGAPRVHPWPTSPNAFIQIGAGNNFTCGVIQNGAVKCWGMNLAGRSSPPSGIFTQISAGDSHACGVTKGGAVKCWGQKAWGAATPPSGTFVQVSAGELLSCGMLQGGTVKCWGSIGSGQSTPSSSAFTQVSAGSAHSCGVIKGGAIKCWGSNYRS